MIRARFVAWRARLYAQNQYLVDPQKDAFGNFRHLGIGVHRSFHQRTKRYRREHVDVTVQVLAVSCDDQIARTRIKSVEVTRHTRIAEIQWRNRTVDFAGENRSGQALIGRLGQTSRGDHKQNCGQESGEEIHAELHDVTTKETSPFDVLEYQICRQDRTYIGRTSAAETESWSTILSNRQSSLAACGLSEVNAKPRARGRAEEVDDQNQLWLSIST